jgi:hypothetical protein
MKSLELLLGLCLIIMPKTSGIKKTLTRKRKTIIDLKKEKETMEKKNSVFF